VRGARIPGILRDAFNRANQAILDAAIYRQGGRKMQSTLSTAGDHTRRRLTRYEPCPGISLRLAGPPRDGETRSSC